MLVILTSLGLAFTLGWNNSGLTTGNLSNLLRYNLAVVVTLVGLFVGFFAEGSKMSTSILGKLIVSPIGTEAILAGTLASLVFFLALTILRIPVSLSNCVVGAFSGVGLASAAIISSSRLIEVVASWLVAPLLCALLAIAFYVIAVRAESTLPITTINWANRVVLIGAVFYVSYALGANNLGLIFSLSVDALTLNTPAHAFLLEIAIFLSLACGTLIFGKALAKVVADRIVDLSQIKTLCAILGSAIVIWSFTQFSIPVSLTQVVIGGMLGAGAARGPTVVNSREVYVMIRDWTIVTVLGAFLGYGIENLIRLL